MTVHIDFFPGFPTGTVCTKTGQLSELQASIAAVKKDVDALRSLTKLLLNHYMLPHEIPSITASACTTACLHVTLASNINGSDMTGIFSQVVETNVQQLDSFHMVCLASSPGSPKSHGAWGGEIELNV